MNSESQLVAEVWELVRDHVPTSQRLETAISYLRTFEEFGFTSKDLAHIVDEDRYLARAYDDLYGEEAEEEDDEVEEL